jgi:hypothetical protein
MLLLEELEPRLVLASPGVVPAIRVVLHAGTIFITPPASGEVVIVSDDGNDLLTIATSHKETWQFAEDQIQQIIYLGRGKGQFTNLSGVQAYAIGGGGRSVLVGQPGDVLVDALVIAILPAPEDQSGGAGTQPFTGPGGSIAAESPQQFLALVAGQLSPQEYAALEAALLPLE